MESLINLVRVELIDDRSVVVNPSFWKALKYRTSAELPVLIITLFTLALTMWTETTKVSLWPRYSVSLASKAIFAHPFVWDASLQWLEHRPSGPMHYLCLTAIYARKAMTCSARSELTSKASSVDNSSLDGQPSRGLPVGHEGGLEALGRESVGSPWMPEVELVGALLPVPMVALSAE
ncbi:hypothetical protein BHM03_00036695 [Ensete ventricosum]|nr:hypothetical protein BHM03_00036695 [Ensete ventricosum]